MQGSDHTWRPTELYGTGWPSNGGGRLVGSLSALPYALAEAEQNFLIPTQTQALIWGDLVPQMILSAKIPRWWNVTPPRCTGSDCTCATAVNCWPNPPSIATCAPRCSPRSARSPRPHAPAWSRSSSEQGAVREALDRVTPAEMYLVARDVGAGRSPQSSCLLAEMKRLADGLSEGRQPCRHLARLRHAQTHAGQLL